MSKRSFWQWLAVSVFVFGGVRIGVARAQTAPSANTGEAPAQANAVVGTQSEQRLTAPQQIENSRRIVSQMSSVRRGVSQMFDRANQERDIIKVNCLNDKLTQIDVAIRSAGEHVELLQIAANVNNDNQRNHEYSLINVYQGRVRALDVEARQCVGEEAAGFGEGTEQGVRVSQTIPTEEVDTTPTTSTETYTPPTPSPVR